MSHRPPPEGFAPLEVISGFVMFAGPLFERRGDGVTNVGFWVEERHCNLWSNCHGGWLSTLADVQLALSCKSHAKIVLPDVARPRLATANMTLDFLAPAPLGSWVEGRGEVLRMSRRTAVAQMTATADGMPCLRASGTFTI